MLIQILGTGCPKCKQLAENTAVAARLAGLDCQIEKVTELSDISAFGIISTPGLAINGRVESAGRVLDPDKIKDLLLAAAKEGGQSPEACSGAAGAPKEECGCGCLSESRAERVDCGCGGASDASGEKKSEIGKTIVLVLVAVVVVALLVFKSQKGTPDNNQDFQQYAVNAEGKRLPRMLEFGSTTCVPCKMMEPVLQALQAKYKDKLSAEFYNVELRGDIANSFKVSTIPTQVFLDPNGKELFRNNGYFPEEDIVKKWAELGYQF